MRAALVTEYRKLVTTRMWWILLACMAAAMVFLAAVLGFALTTEPAGGAAAGQPMSDVDVAHSLYSLAVSLGYAFPLIVGAMMVTGEFRHQTLTPTLLADPSRTRLLVAKLVTGLGAGLVFGVVGTAVSVATGAGVLAMRGHPTLVADDQVLRGIGLGIVAMALWAAVGVGFGAMLRNQVAAIVVILAFNQIVEPLLRIGLAQWTATAGIPRFLPGAAGDAAAGGSLSAAAGTSSLLSWWQGLLVLVGYAAVLTALGRWTTFRRDVT